MSAAIPSDSDDSYGRIVNVISWILLCVMVLTVGTRAATKWTLIRRLEGDDVLALIAFTFSIGQTVALSEAIANGLGEHLGTLSPSQVRNFQQSVYAADLLYIVVLWSAKTSVLLLVRQITPVALHKRITLYVGCGLALWAAVAILAAAVQCHTPHVWQFLDNQCFDRYAFWIYLGISSIVGDTVLIVIPIAIFWNVQIDRRRKATVCGCFASRILVIVATGLQLGFSGRAHGSTDLTLDLWPPALCTQFVQNLSIMTACVPYLKPFYLGLESGMIRTDDLRRHGLIGTYGYGDDESAKVSSRRGPPNTVGSAKSTTSHELRSLDVETAARSAQLNPNNLVAVEASSGVKAADWDQESQTSQSRIIKQTRTWGVDFESQDSNPEGLPVPAWTQGTWGKSSYRAS
ncbi:hypothetical protein HO173_000209 [Letharia columbiana]|uniref:Rhodopsin domain-containing protein n=1 Tax=Letharia columbiana TaxID=112416 RepID=A0A8H6LAG8_9LECA|nr:uncharacterized protein HO173_000209 [Letharia columbiana]KAF6241499.1 hypothetical protein HO173_000209 [Letharia columbiana]